MNFVGCSKSWTTLIRQSLNDIAIFLEGRSWKTRKTENGGDGSIVYFKKGW